MEDKSPKKRSGYLGFIAKVLNEAGGAIVDICELAESGTGKVKSAIKKAPELPEKAKKMIKKTRNLVKPPETKVIKETIKKKEKEIEKLYCEIGKEGAKLSDIEDVNPLEINGVKKMISDVRSYEKEIKRLETRITELEEEKIQKSKQKAKKEIKPDREIPKAKELRKDDKQGQLSVVQAVSKAINLAMTQGSFESNSEKAVFEKVSKDLLDNEIEIKVLASSELGKMNNSAAVPVLIEALKFDNPYLLSETMNALINLGDLRAISEFKAYAKHVHYRVRISCLRGLYKLAEDSEMLPYLRDALRDEHPEVRRTAILFIGWKNDADSVPALVNCFKDDDERVRSAAVSSVSNIRDKSAVIPLIRLLEDKHIEMRRNALDSIKLITGENIAFDFHAAGEQLTHSINDLIEWWQKKRLGDVDFEESITDEPKSRVDVEESDSTDDDVNASEQDPKNHVEPESNSKLGSDMDDEDDTE
ncbi:MAG: HEAT repeat domain-containing protein [Desulfobacterales bacterium]|nr:HEAT repeat domain-containing protein [Desulfobacterales bacterium]